MHIIKTILFILLAFMVLNPNNKNYCKDSTSYYEISNYHRIWNDECSSDESCGKSIGSSDDKGIDPNPSDEFTWKISLLSHFRFLK